MNTYEDILINPNILSNFKSRQPVPLKCNNCKNNYTLNKNAIQSTIAKGSTKNYCSTSCRTIGDRHSILVKCSQCNIEFKKYQSQIDKTKNNFCSKSCSGIYNNKIKTHGNSRSKLEVWLEDQLISIYPDLEFHFNRKDTIGSELDIYIPSLKLAFELNGIFHYEPIFGQDKLQQIQNNDFNKFQQCHANGISLCIIDTSSQKYFKPKTSIKFLEIMTNIIEQSRTPNEVGVGFEPTEV